MGLSDGSDTLWFVQCASGGRRRDQDVPFCQCRLSRRGSRGACLTGIGLVGHGDRPRRQQIQCLHKPLFMWHLRRCRFTSSMYSGSVILSVVLLDACARGGGSERGFLHGRGFFSSGSGDGGGSVVLLSAETFRTVSVLRSERLSNIRLLGRGGTEGAFSNPTAPYTGDRSGEGHPHDASCI